MMGGSRIEGKGTFFQPTVLSEVPPDALINAEETFGPIASLTRFETEEQVMKWANNTPMGLASYFYSRDVGRVWRVAEALEAGMVGTNTGVISQAVIPFGGVKESGVGECCSLLSLVPHACHVQNFWFANFAGHSFAAMGPPLQNLRASLLTTTAEWHRPDAGGIRT